MRFCIFFAPDSSQAPQENPSQYNTRTTWSLDLFESFPIIRANVKGGRGCRQKTHQNGHKIAPKTISDNCNIFEVYFKEFSSIFSTGDCPEDQNQNDGMGDKNALTL